MRVCNLCAKSKPLSEFWANRARADGLNLYCKACCLIKKRDWYNRYHRKGRTGELAPRLWARVDKSAGDEACWPWTGYRSPTGYGAIGNGAGKVIRPHRAAWMLTNGDIPDGLHVLHRCDNPACCNPAHLWLGTHQDNMVDKVAKGRTTLGRKLPRRAKSCE